MPKKNIRIRIVLSVIMTIVLFFVVRNINTTLTFKRLNNNSEFGLDVLYQLSDEDWDNYFIIDGFGMSTIYDTIYPDPFPEDGEFDFIEYSQNNPMTFYDITAYPTYLGKSNYVTGIETTNPDNNLFGIHVQDTLTDEQIRDIFKDYHYKLDRFYENGSSSSYYYSKSRVSIRLYLEDNVVIRIVIRIKVTPIPGMVF